MSTICPLPVAMQIVNNYLPADLSATITDLPARKLMIVSGLFDAQTPNTPDNSLMYLLPCIVALADDDTGYYVIDGCKRLMRVKPDSMVSCAVLSAKMTSAQAGLLRIALNKDRTLHIRERICFLRWLKSTVTGADADAVADALGFTVQMRHELLPLLSCSDEIIDAVVSGKIHSKLVPEFCLLSSADQSAFLAFFSGLLLSQQTQREMLEWLPELAYAQECTVAELLAGEPVQAIVNNAGLNGPQKIETLRNYMYMQKYPLFSEALKTWKKTAAATVKTVLKNEPSSQIVFVPSPAFEKNRLEIRISVAHAKAAREIFGKLADVPDSTWSELIYPVVE
jgi:hypothetical protein